ENSTAMVATLVANSNVTDVTEPTTLTWAIDSGADGSFFNIDAGGALSFKNAPSYEMPRNIAPSASNSNAYMVNVMVTDAAGNVARQTITVNVADINDNPVANGTIAQQDWVVGYPVSFNVANAFSDPDSVNTYSAAEAKWGTLSYTSTGLPNGLTINATGLISGTATAMQAVAPVTVTATDGGGLSATQVFSLGISVAPFINSFSVADSNTANGAQLGKAGDPLIFRVSTSESVLVTPATGAGAVAPQITFNVNGQSVTATYASGSGSNILTFTGGMVPATGNGNNISVTSISLNGGSITGNVSSVALSIGAVGQSYSGYTVDNVALAPTLRLAVDSGSSASDGLTNNVTIHVSGLETGATWQYQVDG
ncbi:MAG: putative Ig domain-containing protein, partial [Methylophilaceae bacterium]|nr:putative Ig domain-containing protein [Methylophilaceae bacterium]